MDNKPLWLSYAVDFAQIGSAVFTAATAFIAVWLALRSEKPRPKFRFSHLVTISLSTGGEGSKHDGRADFLELTIVNTGVLPVVIEHAHVRFYLKKRDGKSDYYGQGLGVFDPTENKATFPAKLEHGHTVRSRVLIQRGVRPWDSFPPFWWILYRPEFVITTSLGKTFRRKPGIKLLYRINREVLS